TENVYHFHPIAFVNHMKRIFGEGSEDCPELVWGNKVSCEFRKRVVQISKRLECDPNHLMTAMALETGGTFNSSRENSLGYVGLIQFGSSAIDDINKKFFLHTAKLTKAWLKSLNQLDQLCYVEYYLEKHKGKLKTLADFYLAILWPIAVGKGDNKNFIVFDDESNGTKKKAYHANPTFHREEDEYKKNSKGVVYERHGKTGGKTYVWEIAEAIQEWYDKGVPEINTSSNCTCDKDCSCDKCIDLTGKVTWISQFNKSERKNGVVKTDGCWRTSQKLLMSAGLSKTSGFKTNLIQVILEKPSTEIVISDNIKAKEGIDYINAELEKGNPVLVGTHYKFGYEGNSDKTTDHYVVIIGRGCENNKVYYRFYEVGTSYPEKGQSLKNKLYLENNFLLKGVGQHNISHEYIVSQVRRN
ncbi:hypothetical protein, partial [Tenacibaculum mesophilum]|uniref:hypothetical protein n=1 Tax=Tenacibaculum mesophilum TaxID=104268 RepID=UPI00069F51B1